MRSIVVCLPGAIERRMVNEIQRHGHRLALSSQRIDEAETAVERGVAEWAVIGAGPEYLTSRMLSTCDVVGVRVVALAAGDTERRHAADLGLREVLDAGASWPQIEEILNAGFSDTQDDADLQRESAVSPIGLNRGGVIAVWGPAGAPGRTTLAITIAAELAAEGHSVVLADADTHSGAVAPSLGLLDEAPGFAAACRLASTDSLDTTELERISDRYSSPHGSFWVLTGIGRARRWPELSGNRVAATLAACRAWVDFTVVDTGFSLEQDDEISSDLFAPQRNAATITALREADQIIAVGAGDPVGLSRLLRAHVDLLEIVDAERVLTVVNRVRGSVIGANPSAQVAHTLLRFGGIVAAALVPHDQMALDSAILSGKTLADVAPKCAPRLALRALVASHLLPQQVEPAKGWLRRSRFEPAPGRTPARL